MLPLPCLNKFFGLGRLSCLPDDETFIVESMFERHSIVSLVMPDVVGVVGGWLLTSDVMSEHKTVVHVESSDALVATAVFGFVGSSLQVSSLSSVAIKDRISQASRAC